MEEETVLCDPRIRYEVQESGQILMLVQFANGETWLPRWREVRKILDKALLVEKINRKRFGKGKPKTLLVYPTIKILKSHGYLKETLFEFDMTAEVHKTDITLGKRIYIASENLEKARKKAIRIFEDSLISRASDLPTFADKLMELKKIVVREYVRKKRWKETAEGEYF